MRQAQGGCDGAGQYARPMRALVTGTAGFIGSNLAARLLADGWLVRGVDNFSTYYAASMKRSNVSTLVATPGFELIETDLLTASLEPMLSDVDVVFHHAAQPGVRQSWAEGFRAYTANNVDVTQRLLEAAAAQPSRRFVYASSSSVYGNATAYPTDEVSATMPYSPYGVTKLAGEQLCRAYANNFGLSVVALRYFTVYGPAQRPDMATHRMIEAALDQTSFEIFGDGSQIRDFTFVGDVVAANLRAACVDVEPGEVFNVAGGSAVSLSDLIGVVGDVVGAPVPTARGASQPGDVARTGAAIDKAVRVLGWSPEVDIVAGVARQVEWHRARRS